MSRKPNSPGPISIDEKYIGLIWTARAVFDPGLRSRAERMRAGPHRPPMNSIPSQVGVLIEDAFRVGLSSRLFRSAAAVPFYVSGKSAPLWEALPFPALAWGPHLLAWCIDLHFGKPLRRADSLNDPATALFLHCCADWRAASKSAEGILAGSPFSSLHFLRVPFQAAPAGACISAFSRADLRPLLMALRGDLCSRWRAYLLQAVTHPVDEFSDSLTEWGAFFSALPGWLQQPDLIPFVPALLLVMEGFLPQVNALATRTWESERTLAARATDRRNLATFFDAIVRIAEMRNRLRGISFVDETYDAARAALRYFDSPREEIFERASFVSARLKEL